MVAFKLEAIASR